MAKIQMKWHVNIKTWLDNHTSAKFRRIRMKLMTDRNACIRKTEIKDLLTLRNAEISRIQKKSLRNNLEIRKPKDYL